MTYSPQWTAPMYPPKVGRDHLGLGSVSSDQILPSLVPDINVLTFHPRYHSLYTFLLDEFWRRELPRTRRSWVTFFRPRDYIFCLGAFLCQQPEHGELPECGGKKVTLISTLKTRHAPVPTSAVGIVLMPLIVRRSSV